MIGVAFVALVIWFGYLIFIRTSSADLWVFIVEGIFAALALFFFNVGYRLFFDRPNKYGSVLGPTGRMGMGVRPA